MSDAAGSTRRDERSGSFRGRARAPTGATGGGSRTGAPPRVSLRVHQVRAAGDGTAATGRGSRTVHLKSLTVKGFKSFASATTLRLEPGITCVVGPNGSGKSNVVDAIAWVLGEQGAKALRGGKMEDVIFAGTAGRAPLGRAEVTLTIDNTDGALPIDYTEVSITRRMFRSGESEYEINGDSCRLLDIQELLSDSGIGREMHVIVGQGQLDAVLHAKPEDRRAFIEEAAGVLKHRKRKEKALRKLDAMQANLNRLTDLTAELRRQLKPLGRQAEVARRAAAIQADLRDARLRLLADDLATLRDHPGQGDRRRDRAARAARAGRGASTSEVQGRLAELEAALAEDAPALAAGPGHLVPAVRAAGALPLHRTSSPPSGCGTSPRRPDDERPGRDPDAAGGRGRARSASRRRSCARRSTDDQVRLAEAVERRQELERQLAAAERALVAAVKAIADRREGLAKLDRPGQRRARPDRQRRRGDRPARRRARRGAGRAPRRRRPSYDAVADRVHRGRPGQRRPGRPARRGGRRARRGRRPRVKQLADAERAAEKDAASWKAREEALALGLRRKDGAGALLGPRRPGARPARQRRRAAHRRARARGRARRRARRARRRGRGLRRRRGRRGACELLKTDDAGRAGAARRQSGRPGMPARRRAAPGAARGRALGARPGATAPDELRPAVHRALRDVVLRRPTSPPRADRGRTRPGAARGHPGRRPARRVRGGRRLGQGAQLHRGAGRRRGGPAPTGSPPSAPVAELRDAARRGARRGGRRARRPSQRGRRRQAGGRGRSATPPPAGSPSSARPPARRRPRPTGSAQSRAKAEAGPRAGPGRPRRAGGAAAAAPRTTPIDDGPVHRGARPARRRWCRRPGRTRWRSGSPCAPPRSGSALDRRPGRLAAAPGRRRAGRPGSGPRPAGPPAPAAPRSPRPSVGGAARGADPARRRRWPRPASTATRVARARDRAGRPSCRRYARAAKRLGAELERLTYEVHRDEVARAEQRLRIEQLEAQGRRGVRRSTWRRWSPSTARTSSSRRPQAEVAAAEARRPAGARAGAVTTGRRRRSGPPRPNATWPCSARSTRWRWRSSPRWRSGSSSSPTSSRTSRPPGATCSPWSRTSTTGSWRSSPRAFDDTAREFEQVFTVLFPGGEGRLVLTDPDDMLTTGVEVEARPPGKKIKRLSLLSGGERSLTAVALLVRDLPGPAQPVLHHGRGRGGARRRQPRPADHPAGSSCGRRAS